jgi:hypothetical protein
MQGSVALKAFSAAIVEKMLGFSWQFSDPEEAFPRGMSLGCSGYLQCFPRLKPLVISKRQAMQLALYMTDRRGCNINL